MHQDWKMQNIVVTGAASGLGRAICARFVHLNASRGRGRSPSCPPRRVLSRYEAASSKAGSEIRPYRPALLTDSQIAKLFANQARSTTSSWAIHLLSLNALAPVNQEH